MSENLKNSILNWYANGEKGLSSEAMAAALSGNTPTRIYHPGDPADLNRCIKLVAAVPESRSHLQEVAKLSPQWEKIIKHWDELEKSFIDEVGFDWCKAKSAPKTFKLMNSLGC